MSLGTMEQRTEGMKRQAQELIEQAYQRGYKAGYDKAFATLNENWQLVTSEAEEKGRNEAWEAAKKIYSTIKNGALHTDEIRKIFDVRYLTDVLEEFSASEAIEKLRAYEKKKKEDSEIRVGDEVELNEVKVIVTKIDGKFFDGVGHGGGVYSRRELRLWKKTGIHYDIDKIL